jgi:hypothetical protein
MIIAPDDDLNDVPNDDASDAASENSVEPPATEDPDAAEPVDASRDIAGDISMAELDPPQETIPAAQASAHAEALAADEEAFLREAPQRAPHSRPIPETDGYLRIVLPIARVKRDSWQTRARHIPRAALAFAGRHRIAVVAAFILIVLLLGGTGYAVTDYYAPAAAANGFCADLQSRDFDSAYSRLSSDLQAQISRERFQEVGQALDEGEGRVTACDINLAPGSYSRTPGAASATTQASIRRSLTGRQGGRLALTRENGSWRITTPDAMTPGMDLSALGVVSAYCLALRERDYLAAYVLLDQNLQGDLPFGQFTDLMRASEAIDGPIQNCGLSGMRGQVIGKTTLIAVVRRGVEGVYRGAIVLSGGAGHWEITSVAATAMGSDLGPLRLGARFCADLTSGAYDDAYTLFGDRFQSRITRAQLSDDLRPDAGANWTACAPVLRSYHVEGDQAMLEVSLTATFSDGATTVQRLRLVFTHVDSRWSLDGVQF